MNTTIRTFSGAFFDFAAPTPQMVRLEDIAHALSNCCRFCGQSREFYSVAQHSILVSELVLTDDLGPNVYDEVRLQALLHDASEAYTGDIVTPLKRILPDFQVIEAGIQAVIEIALLSLQPTPETEARIKVADREALAIEGGDYMPGRTGEYGIPISGRRSIPALPPPLAEALFLDRFTMLTRSNGFKTPQETHDAPRA